MLFLDTDILIDVQRAHPPAVAWFGSLAEVPAISGLTKMELIQSAHNHRQVRETLRLIAPCPVFWPTPNDCERAVADLSRYGVSDGLGLIDALIAATVVRLNARLCTFNTKHFRVVAGLELHQPYLKR